MGCQWQGPWPISPGIAEKVALTPRAVMYATACLVEIGVLRKNTIAGVGVEYEMVKTPELSAGVTPELSSPLPLNNVRAREGAGPHDPGKNLVTKKQGLSYDNKTPTPLVQGSDQLFAVPVSQNGSYSDPADVREVWDAWVASTGRSRSVLDDRRRTLIATGLRTFPVTVLVDAVRGWKHSAFHNGEQTGRTWNDIELILRDAKHVEQFAGFSRTSVDEVAQRERMLALMERATARTRRT